MGKRYTVCVDFDGVLHNFDGRWKGHSSIEGEPIDGAIAWLTGIAEDFDVAILTTRGATLLGQNAVLAWLERYGFVVPPTFVVTDEKPPALVYLDDRAWRFDGRFPTAQEIHDARPWNRGGPKDDDYLFAKLKVRADVDPDVFERHLDEMIAMTRRSMLNVYRAGRS